MRGRTLQSLAGQTISTLRVTPTQFAKGEIGINVEEASCRRAFVGAALATLPRANA